MFSNRTLYKCLYLKIHLFGSLPVVQSRQNVMGRFTKYYLFGEKQIFICELPVNRP